MIKITVLFLLFFPLSCTKPKKDLFFLSNSNFLIEIRLSKKKEDVVGICFSKKLIINNPTKSVVAFKTVNYIYNDSLSNWLNRNVGLFEIKNEKLKKVSNFEKKEFSPFKKKDYIFYTRHFVDSSKQTQQQFKPYIDRMLSENKDTLHIGTVAEFKSKHDKLFERLTQNDSISIQFLEGDALGERITVPVNW